MEKTPEQPSDPENSFVNGEGVGGGDGMELSPLEMDGGGDVAIGRLGNVVVSDKTAKVKRSAKRGRSRMKKNRVKSSGNVTKIRKMERLTTGPNDACTTNQVNVARRLLFGLRSHPRQICRFQAGAEKPKREDSAVDGRNGTSENATAPCIGAPVGRKGRPSKNSNHLSSMTIHLSSARHAEKSSTTSAAVSAETVFVVTAFPSLTTSSSATASMATVPSETAAAAASSTTSSEIASSATACVASSSLATVSIATSSSADTGVLVWARLSCTRFWPAISIDPVLCGQKISRLDRVWVFWFGDYKISEVSVDRIVPFAVNFSKKFDKSGGKTYRKGIDEIVRIYAERTGFLDGRTSDFNFFEWAQNGFHSDSNIQNHEQQESSDNNNKHLPSWVREKLDTLRSERDGRESEKGDGNRDTEERRKRSEKRLTANITGVISEKKPISDVNDVCIACSLVLSARSVRYEHPFFHGGLCQDCRVVLLKGIFLFGEDGSNAYCVICGIGGVLFVCEMPGCNKVFCGDCVKRLAGEEALCNIRKIDRWYCFLCLPFTKKSHGLLKGKENWSSNLSHLFQPFQIQFSRLNLDINRRRPIRVLSLFDGIATGKLVLDRLKIRVDEYIASEVDQAAMTVAQTRHPGSIVHVGDVCNLGLHELEKFCPIDLLIGGSPCNELSIANPNRKGLEGGTGLLFFEYFRILKSVTEMNRGHELFWLYENVASMSAESRSTISRFFQCEPALWDAKYFSAMKRARYFWGNIPEMYCPVQYVNKELHSKMLQESLFPTRKAAIQKIRTITTQPNSLLQQEGSDEGLPVIMESGIRDKVWIPEVESVFGFPEHYTDVANLTPSRRLKLIGQSWCVPVMCHLFSPLKNYFASTSKEE